MEIDSNRNINKADVSPQNSQLPAALSKSSRAQGAAHAAPEIHPMKSSDKPIKETALPTDN